jgi:membrane protease YdiL (CAAX protease family)
MRNAKVNFYDRLFYGTFRWMLTMENGGRFALDTYYALSAVLIVIVVEILFVYSIVLYLGRLDVFSTTTSIAAFLLVLVLGNWFAFFKGSRWKTVVERGRKEFGRGPEWGAICVVVFSFLTFLTVVVYTASTFD